MVVPMGYSVELGCFPSLLAVKMYFIYSSCLYLTHITCQYIPSLKCAEIQAQGSMKVMVNHSVMVQKS